MDKEQNNENLKTNLKTIILELKKYQETQDIYQYRCLTEITSFLSNADEMLQRYDIDLFSMDDLRACVDIQLNGHLVQQNPLSIVIDEAEKILNEIELKETTHTDNVTPIH